MTEVTHDLDLSGLNCPLPIIRTKKKLTTMASGEVLRVVSTDPGSALDFEAFAKQTGHELLESRKDNGSFVFKLKKQ